MTYVTVASVTAAVREMAAEVSDMTDRGLKAAATRLANKDNPTPADKKRLRELKAEIKKRSGSDGGKAAKPAVEKTKPKPRTDTQKPIASIKGAAGKYLKSIKSPGLARAFREEFEDLPEFTKSAVNDRGEVSFHLLSDDVKRKVGPLLHRAHQAWINRKHAEYDQLEKQVNSLLGTSTTIPFSRETIPGPYRGLPKSATKVIPAFKGRPSPFHR